MPVHLPNVTEELDNLVELIMKFDKGFVPGLSKEHAKEIAKQHLSNWHFIDRHYSKFVPIVPAVEGYTEFHPEISKELIPAIDTLIQFVSKTSGNEYRNKFMLDWICDHFTTRANFEAFLLLLNSLKETAASELPPEHDRPANRPITFKSLYVRAMFQSLNSIKSRLRKAKLLEKLILFVLDENQSTPAGYNSDNQVNSINQILREIEKNTRIDILDENEDIPDPGGWRGMF